MSLAPELLAILVCPTCKDALDLQPVGTLTCRTCCRPYAIVDDIPALIVDDTQAARASAPPTELTPRRVAA